MIELNEIKVKEKPRYVEPMKKKKNNTEIIMIVIVLYTITMILMISLFKNDKIAKEQQAEIERLQNKVYQDIELIDSLKQVNYK